MKRKRNKKPTHENHKENGNKRRKGSSSSYFLNESYLNNLDLNYKSDNYNMIFPNISKFEWIKNRSDYKTTIGIYGEVIRMKSDHLLKSVNVSDSPAIITICFIWNITNKNGQWSTDDSNYICTKFKNKISNIVFSSVDICQVDIHIKKQIRYINKTNVKT